MVVELLARLFVRFAASLSLRSLSSEAMDFTPVFGFVQNQMGQRVDQAMLALALLASAKALAHMGRAGGVRALRAMFGIEEVAEDTVDQVEWRGPPSPRRLDPGFEDVTPDVLEEPQPQQQQQMQTTVASSTIVLGQPGYVQQEVQKYEPKIAPVEDEQVGFKTALANT